MIEFRKHSKPVWVIIITLWIAFFVAFMYFVGVPIIKQYVVDPMQNMNQQSSSKDIGLIQAKLKARSELLLEGYGFFGKVDEVIEKPYGWFLFSNSFAEKNIHPQFIFVSKSGIVDPISTSMHIDDYISTYDHMHEEGTIGEYLYKLGLSDEVLHKLSESDIGAIDDFIVSFTKAIEDKDIDEIMRHISFPLGHENGQYNMDDREIFLESKHFLFIAKYFDTSLMNPGEQAEAISTAGFESFEYFPGPTDYYRIAHVFHKSDFSVYFDLRKRDGEIVLDKMRIEEK